MDIQEVVWGAGTRLILIRTGTDGEHFKCTNIYLFPLKSGELLG